MLAQIMSHIYLIDDREIIPYKKSLREFAGSITATILMQRLELHFQKHPDGFTKPFTTNSKVYGQKENVSWQEELGCSKEEFVASFNYIGMRHRTKSRYQSTLHSFYNNENKEKYYCSYHDNHTGLTWYFRNHRLVDKLAEKLLLQKV